jgi:hypothetical protein
MRHEGKEELKKQMIQERWRTEGKMKNQWQSAYDSENEQPLNVE